LFRDRSSGAIDGWDSIHCDGVSWDASGVSVCLGSVVGGGKIGWKNLSISDALLQHLAEGNYGEPDWESGN